MDPVSLTLTALLVVWGLLGIYVGNRTLRRQRDAGKAAQQRAYLANLGASRFQQVQWFVQEYAPLLERQDVDPAVFERVLTEAYTLLDTIVNEANAVSEDLTNNSLTNVQNLLSAFHLLREFTQHGLDIWQQRFGSVEAQSVTEPQEAPDDEEASDGAEGLFRDASRQLKRADKTVRTVRQRVATAP